MIRSYELSKQRHGSVLRCETRRFLRDVACYLSYSFSEGTFKVHFPQSWLPIEASEELRRFAELVRSPHWRAEIEPNLNRVVNDCLFDMAFEDLL